VFHSSGGQAERPLMAAPAGRLIGLKRGFCEAAHLRVCALRIYAGARRSQRGVTAIETAIIMIAFVTVASIAAFTTLSTGFFAADEGRAAILSGVTKAKSSIVLRGGAFASRGSIDVDGDNTIVLSSTSSDTQAVVKFTFIVSGALNDSVIDLTPPYTTNGAGIDPDASGLAHATVISFRSKDTAINDTAWTVNFIGSDDGDYFLEQRERAEITVWLSSHDLVNDVWDLGSGSSDPFIDSAGELIKARTLFAIEVGTSEGSVFAISRTTPSSLDAVMNLN
jgi:archaellin